jgi:hypothetical protein
MNGVETGLGVVESGAQPAHVVRVWKLGFTDVVLDPAGEGCAHRTSQPIP